MSVTGDLNRDASGLMDLIKGYERKLEKWREDISIDGKNIEEVNMQQASLTAYYDQIKIELKAILDFLDMKVKETRSKSLKALNKNSSLSLSDRAKEKILDSDKSYISIYKLFLIAKEVHAKSDMVANNFAQRSYTLNNIVKIREKELENITLYENGH